jgi:tetratricopeptide (TPR) repeat protein
MDSSWLCAKERYPKSIGLIISLITLNKPYTLTKSISKLLEFTPVKNTLKKSVIALSLITLTCSVGLLSGCDDDRVVFQKSVAILNQKAKQYLEAGDANKATARLEAALELLPNDGLTLNNLAIAYHNKEAYQQAIETYQRLFTVLKEHRTEAGQIPKTMTTDTILQSMGASYEALGDQFYGDAETLKETPGASAAKAPEIMAKAQSAYQNAIDTYKQLSGDRADVAQQIQALTQRLEEIKNPEQ